MCRSKELGGRRCSRDIDTVNCRRRDRYAVRTASKMVDEVIETQGSEWVGDMKGIGLLLNSPLLAKSYALAVKAHAGIRRKSSEVYLNHPLRVARRLQEAGFNHEVIAVALLHDAVEDSSMTLGYLRKHGLNERIVSGVDSVTKREGENYEAAILRASAHPIGRLVKLSDNLDNSSDEQLAPFSPQKQERQRAKYFPARKIMIESISTLPAHELMLETQGFHQGYEVKVDKSIVSSIFG